MSRAIGRFVLFTSVSVLCLAAIATERRTSSISIVRCWHRSRITWPFSIIAANGGRLWVRERSRWRRHGPLPDSGDGFANTYASGKDFMAALERDPSCADCLILDTHMPEMSGIELQRHLIANGVDTPIIVVTADEASDAPSRYVASGIAAYLVKPVSSEDLLAAIARAVRPPESPVGSRDDLVPAGWTRVERPCRA